MAAIDTSGMAVWSPGDLKLTAYPIPGMYLDGTGDYASTPDDNTLDITGDIDIRAAVLLTDYTTATPQMFVNKYKVSTNQKSYRFGVNLINSTGLLSLDWSANGSAGTIVTSSTGLTTTDGTPVLVRVTLKVANPYQIKFYTRPFFATTYAADLTDDTVSASAWVQLGTTANGAVGTSIFNSTSPLEVGAAASDSVDYVTGAVYGVSVKDGIAGTEKANPDFGAQLDATAAFTDDAGRTWSMNGDAYMMPRVSDGWLACSGDSLDTTTYADLFAAIRYRFGGSGANFNIPDVMKTKRFLQGGFSPGATGGATALVTGAPSAVTAALAGGGGPTPGTATHTHTVTDGRPPWMDVAVWIKI